MRPCIGHVCNRGMGELHPVFRSSEGDERWLSPQRQVLTMFQVFLQLTESEVTYQVFLKVAVPRQLLQQMAEPPERSVKESAAILSSGVRASLPLTENVPQSLEVQLQYFSSFLSLS